MGKVTYEKVETAEPVHFVTGAAEQPRRFHSHFANCFGNCDAIGWGSCCLVYWCPCIAFGMNVANATGKVWRGIAYALMFITAMAGIRGSNYALQYQLHGNPCVDNSWEDEPCTDTDLEEVLDVAIRWGIVSLLAFAAFVTLGVVNRRRLRRTLNLKYDVEGGCAECCDDTCAWCCYPTGLCQETRTMFYNRVENGEWRGPLTLAYDVAPRK